MIILFSKNRAIQLDLCLRSMKKYMQDFESAAVIYTTDSYAHAESYDHLKYEHPEIKFIKENNNFKKELLDAVETKGEKFVTFIVDDNIFVRNFVLYDGHEVLTKQKYGLGFSLRLGRNTTMCYPINRAQALPSFQTMWENILTYNWTTANYDFGYPLELSSSTYEIKTIMPILEGCEYNSPNTLEAIMDYNKSYFISEKPLLYCYGQSVAFCNPINKVQVFNNNRCGINEKYTPDSLLKMYEKGKRISLEQFEDFVPTGAHEEVEIEFV